jgi:hypothetical protein
MIARYDDDDGEYCEESELRVGNKEHIEAPHTIMKNREKP